jgi:hypothetical protein
LNDNPILSAHVAELDPAYGIFARVTDERLRSEAARLIDFLRGEEIPVPRDVPIEAIPHLRAAAESAHPDRKCLGLLAARFGSWLSGVNAESRREFLDGMVSLGPALADLGEEGMTDVIAAVNRDPRLMACVSSYALTTRPIVLAIAKLALMAPVEWLQRLTAAVNVATMEESKDAERLLPALAPLPDAVPAIVTLAERNVSSAYGACRGLPAALKKAGENRAAYLEDMRRLAETVGISSVGFTLDKLPGLYRTAGPARASEFVQLAAECARLYGQTAGQAFLERQTKAAAQAVVSTQPMQ